MPITPKVKMIVGLVVLIAGAIIFAKTKQSLTFLIALAGYVIWRWGQNEQARLDKAREAEEDRTAKSGAAKSNAAKAGTGRQELVKSGSKKPSSKK